MYAYVYRFLTLDTKVRLGYVGGGGGGGSVCTHVHSCSARGAVCKANNKHVGAKHTKYSYVCVCKCIHRHRVSFIDTKLQF